MVPGCLDILIFAISPDYIIIVQRNMVSDISSIIYLWIGYIVSSVYLRSDENVPMSPFNISKWFATSNSAKYDVIRGRKDPRIDLDQTSTRQYRRRASISKSNCRISAIKEGTRVIRCTRIHVSDKVTITSLQLWQLCCQRQSDAIFIDCGNRNVDNKT